MPAGETYDGRVRIFWLDNDPANPAEPTIAEIEAGKHLSGYGIPDGVAYNIGNERVSGRDLLSSFNAESPGRRAAAPVLTLRRKLRGSAPGQGELAWETLGERNIQGCLVVFEAVDEGRDVAAGDACFVFLGAETGEPVPVNTAPNAETRFEAHIFCTDMELNAAVVGS